MKKYFLLTGFLTLTLQNKAQTVSDADGNTYNTVTIGTQVWMKENLKTTKYYDGASIPLVTGISAWGSLTSPAYCSYNNTSNADTINTYGRLYNWYVVNTGKLCPSGWHVPSSNEWTILEDYLIANGFNYDGSTSGNKYAKALASTSGWVSNTSKGSIGNTDYPEKRNATGFSAFPGGARQSSVSPVSNSEAFISIGKFAVWWTTTEISTQGANLRSVNYSESSVWRDDTHGNDKRLGYSVRCLKDNNNPDNINNCVKESVFIYPNPASDKLYIMNHLTNANLVITDLQSKQIMNIKIGINPIDISSLRSGVYLIKIIDSGKTMIFKLIKK